MRVRFTVRLSETVAVDGKPVQVGAQSDDVLLALSDAPLPASELTLVDIQKHVIKDANSKETFGKESCCEIEYLSIVVVTQRLRMPFTKSWITFLATILISIKLIIIENK